MISRGSVPVYLCGCHGDASRTRRRAALRCCSSWPQRTSHLTSPTPARWPFPGWLEHQKEIGNDNNYNSDNDTNSNNDDDKSGNVCGAEGARAFALKSRVKHKKHPKQE